MPEKPEPGMKRLVVREEIEYLIDVPESLDPDDTYEVERWISGTDYWQAMDGLVCKSRSFALEVG